MSDSAIHSALGQWQELLGSERVLTGEDCTPYSRCTLSEPRRIPVVLRPRNEEDVVEIVRIAGQHNMALYPISTGNNWGYGAANPVKDGCAIVDLSELTRIRFNEQLGTVTLQPGVTTQQLHGFLTRRDAPFLVPVTGAGPNCSIVGNAIERGFGLTPHSDHFSAVLGLRAVLADGSIYQPALTEATQGAAPALHKWGIGPYLDGIFTQGCFGIITEMTIALAPKAANRGMMFFEFKDEKLDEAVAAVQQLMTRCPGMIGGLNLMNRLRMQAMIPEQKTIPDWTGIATLYASDHLWPGLKREIREALAPCTRRRIIFTRPRLKKAAAFACFLPGALEKRIMTRVDKLSEAMDMVDGKPIYTALRLVYSQMKEPASDEKLNPARDGCGLIWYAPLVPMQAGAVREYVKMVEDICPRHAIKPMITLTSISSRAFDSTVPLLFDRNKDRDVAIACYNDLYLAGKQKGFMPYRMHIDAMGMLTGNPDSVFWGLVKKLKNAADPKGIIAPGRYCPPD